ncbi:MAG: universal stress protein [Synechococcales cyanobacterium RM1_1_8]|nr:universal stress protein [Synechococcales cyanobacterium RM1_1_8]
MFSTVLFPLDDSRESREAAEMVAQFAKLHQSQRVVLLSVFEGDAAAPDGSGGMASHGAIAELLDNAKSMFATQGVTTEALECQGKPAFAICDIADEIQADVIIMGCRGMGLTEGGAAESVTNRVINLAPCPVLVVP